MCKGCQQPYKVAVIRKDGEVFSKAFDTYEDAAGCYHANGAEVLAKRIMGHCGDNHSWVTVASMSL